MRKTCPTLKEEAVRAPQAFRHTSRTLASSMVHVRTGGECKTNRHHGYNFIVTKARACKGKVCKRKKKGNAHWTRR